MSKSPHFWLLRNLGQSSHTGSVSPCDRRLGGELSGHLSFAAGPCARGFAPDPTGPPITPLAHRPLSSRLQFERKVYSGQTSGAPFLPAIIQSLVPRRIQQSGRVLTLQGFAPPQPLPSDKRPTPWYELSWYLWGSFLTMLPREAHTERLQSPELQAILSLPGPCFPLLINPFAWHRVPGNGVWASGATPGTWWLRAELAKGHIR